MIEFKNLDNAELVLRHSLFVRSTALTLDYCAEHGGIGLTTSKGFKRTFVDWAARAFDWPGYTSEDLYAVNKVLNEMDLPPLGFIREALLALKIGRHYKGEFKLTCSGKELVGNPAQLFGIIAPFYLFEFDHWAYSRRPTAPMGNWDIFLNVINVEADTAITGVELVEKIFGIKQKEKGLFGNPESASFFSGVLQPLCWIGFLEEIKVANNYFADRLYVKTPLWKEALRLDTDHYIHEN